MRTIATVKAVTATPIRAAPALRFRMARHRGPDCRKRDTTGPAQRVRMDSPPRWVFTRYEIRIATIYHRERRPYLACSNIVLSAHPPTAVTIIPLTTNMTR